MTGVTKRKHTPNNPHPQLDLLSNQTRDARSMEKLPEKSVGPSINIEVFDEKNPRTISNVVRKIPIVVADEGANEMKDFLKAFVAAEKS